MLDKTSTRSLQDGTLYAAPTQLPQDAVSQILDGLTITTDGDAALPLQICAEHLALLGAHRAPQQPNHEQVGIDCDLAGALTLQPQRRHDEAALMDEVNCTIRWQGTNAQAPQLLGSEVLVQAISGLMAVH